MIRPIVVATGSLFFVLIGIMLIVVGFPRLGGPSAIGERLNACEAPCTWEHFDTRDLQVGDILVAFGRPYGISIVENLAAQTPYFRELLFFPAHRLTVAVENTEDFGRIGPHTTHGLTLITSPSPAMWLPWRGFTKLCRYYPGVYPFCVSSAQPR